MGQRPSRAGPHGIAAALVQIRRADSAVGSSRPATRFVMPALVASIHDFTCPHNGVDARDKHGHDGRCLQALRILNRLQSNGSDRALSLAAPLARWGGGPRSARNSKNDPNDGKVVRAVQPAMAPRRGHPTTHCLVSPEMPSCCYKMLCNHYCGGQILFAM